MFVPITKKKFLMNPMNQKLYNGINIFFKVMYIFLIVVFCINFLSQVALLFMDKQASVLSVFYVIQKPDITLNMAGKILQPDTLFGIGAVFVKGTPVGIKICNSLSLLIALFIYILILRIIRSIIKSIAQNDVFSLLNAGRLKKIGFLMLIELVLSYSVTIINSFSIQTFNQSSIASCIGMMVGEASSYLIAIAFTFFIAAVFKIGVNIQEENQSIV